MPLRNALLGLFGLAFLAWPLGAQAETDWFASLYTNDGVELRADERVFATYALLNGMGYDEAPLVRAHPAPLREMHPVRLKVRAEARIDAADAAKLNGFFDAHPRAAEAYGRYALTLKGPPAFERSAASPGDLKGFELPLADGYSRLGLAALFASVQDEYRVALKSYHGVVDAPVAAVRRLLKLKEDEPPRVVLVVNLLDGQGKAYSALSGEELWVVVGPSKTPDLYAVAREVARGRVEPLVAAKASDAEGAAWAADVLARAFASAALGLSDAEIDARAHGENLREWTRQVDAFAKSDRTLESFVGEAAPALVREAGARKASKGK